MFWVHAYASTVTISENTLFYIMQLAIDRFLQDRWKKNQHFTLNYVQLSHISNISQIKQTVLMNI